MRIIIDMQGAQTKSRLRGIGRYTLALSEEMARLRGEHEVILALNGLFPDTIESIRAAFAGLLPEENIRVWDAAGPVHAMDPSNDARRRAAEMAREAFITSLQPDIVLNTSLFEGLGDDAITSIGSFTNCLPTAVILYDLCPLIYRDIYLKNPVIKRWYLNKLDHLRRADLLLSISASSWQDAIDYLGFPPEKIANISAACDSQFHPVVVNGRMHARLRDVYNVRRPFVLYTTADDARKNNDNLISAYACLPDSIRQEHQLVLVSSFIDAKVYSHLMELGRELGLDSSELVILTSISDEELITLYNACRVFVFPSTHEGFGLPALEAMACGRAVIGANNSSVPEVIGREDALFDPFDVEAIARKIAEVLAKDAFRAELERHGLAQAKNFSWEQTARRAWEALEAFVSERKQTTSIPNLKFMQRRPRLAYISPLPPEKSGISDYSAELLPELARHYEIEVIVAQKEVSDSWILANCPVRDVAWFRQNAHRFDRVMYHFGNSDFHNHMFELLGEFPGVVVLHDFFLSSIVSHMEFTGVKPHAWARALVHAHGWSALQSRYQAKDTGDVVWAYPCNLEVLQQALGVIVHSEYSRRLAENWYGIDAANDWSLIPHLRVPLIKTDRYAARQSLGLTEEDFVVCSFGLLGPIKLNHRLLSAWLASPLANDPYCRLVFVGQNHGGDYGADLVRAIRGSAEASRIEITGWADAGLYRTWLAAADVGVQLRTLSRGETPGTVLDCMNHGLATIVNAHGSTADLPADAAWMLPDEFSDEQLIEALTTLWRDSDRRQTLGQRARDVIQLHHQPRRCAEQYAQAIERFYQRASVGLPALVDALANVEPALPAEDWPRVATVLANNVPPRPRRKQLLLDISALVQHDLKTGIQRVVRTLLREFLLNPPEEWAVEPVYATSDTQGYRYARRFISRFLGVYDGRAEDEPVESWQGDIFLGLDLQPTIVPVQKDYLLAWHRRGIKVFFVVYDLLPVLLPHVFPDGAQPDHQRWLETISRFDGMICISRAVADELHDWLQAFGPKRERPFALSWFHLGADVENSVPTTGMPAGADQVFEVLSARPSFLMVGTVEPRKGYLQTLAAFTALWNEGLKINLVIVGQEGWKPVPDSMRHTIPEIVRQLRGHPEFGKRLFWLEGTSDEYLGKVYAACTCLIAASEGEGFGLPLIEAAQHKLPIIARGIPVFREVAGEHAYYFSGTNPKDLANTVTEWLELYRKGCHPRSDNMAWLTWNKSAKKLLNTILHDQWYKYVIPDVFIRPGIIKNHLSQHLSWQGFSVPEKDFRWTDGLSASIGFELNKAEVGEALLYLKFNTLGKQSIALELNNQNIFIGDFDGHNVELVLPIDSLVQGENTLKLSLPNAHHPGTDDHRQLALAIRQFGILKSFYFEGSDPRILTNVGSRSGKSMHTSGRPGQLLYGPCLALATGRYRLIVTGTAEQGTGHEWMDVAYARGKCRVLYISLDRLPKGAWQQSVAFTLEKGVSDLQFRLWVDEGTRLAVDGIELAPVTEECAEVMTNATEKFPMFSEQADKVLCDQTQAEAVAAMSYHEADHAPAILSENAIAPRINPSYEQSGAEHSADGMSETGHFVPPSKAIHAVGVKAKGKKRKKSRLGDTSKRSLGLRGKNT